LDANEDDSIDLEMKLCDVLTALLTKEALYLYVIAVGFGIDLDLDLF